MKKQKDFKEEKIDMFMKKDGLIILIIIYLAVFLLFFVPIIKTQYLIVGINGEGSNAQVGYSYVSEIRKPIINLFSPANPTNGFILKVSIIDENKTSISGDLYNVGTGESSFKINSATELIGNISVSTSLLYNGEILQNKTFEGKIR